MKNSFWLIAVLFSVVLFQSCLKDPVTENPLETVEPELPPMAMYSMPTTALQETETDTTAALMNGMTYYNWWHAAVNVVVWHSIVSVHMAIPTAAFNMAFNEPAEYIGNGTFEWTYQYIATPLQGGQTYNVSLTGQYQNNYQDVLWTMTVSQVGAFSNFVWYSGLVATDLSEGEFTLNRFPGNPEPYLHIEYDSDPTVGDQAIRYTNVIANSPDYGQYIEYRVRPTDAFNRAFDVQGVPNNFLEIRWNEPSGDGQVKHPLHFNDNEWHCWDTAQIDIDCE
ncbi:MAG: hypothetical protein KDC34_14960 [Saprospiraceae bacterium]|nr:hypothetical protein [Saprospiraceae bacterium]